VQVWLDYPLQHASLLGRFRPLDYLCRGLRFLILPGLRDDPALGFLGFRDQLLSEQPSGFPIRIKNDSF